VKGPLAALAGGVTVLLVAGFLATVLGGTAAVAPGDAARALVDPAGASPLARTIVLEVRLPRVLLLLLAGAALATTGAALQATLQNPLADPGLLGLAGGAALGAVLVHAAEIPLRAPWMLPAAAFAGAVLALAVVFAVAHAAARPGAATVILAGVAVASFASAIVSVLLLATGEHRVHEIFAWLLGSAEGRGWEHLRLALGPALGGIAGLVASARLLDALALGDEHAAGLGVDLARARGLVFGLVALAAGSVVAVTGPIGFVGLMVPHAVRPFSGAGARALLPASALAGGAFLALADLAARIVSPTFDLPVGVVTALAGVPFLLALLRRAAR